MALILKAVALVYLTHVSSSALHLKKIGEFAVNKPAFASIGHEGGGGDLSKNWTLLISSFAAFSITEHDELTYCRNLETYLPGSVDKIEPIVLTTKVVWPNEFKFVPREVFGKDTASAATGFLVPFKGKGAISLFDMSSSPPTGPHDITYESSSESWFYHRVLWHDMNGDGRLDALTARAEKPLIGATNAQFLWLEQPESSPLTQTWTEHQLTTDGPDIFFLLMPLPTPQKNIIVAAEFFAKKLCVLSKKSPAGAWTADNMQSYTIDSLDAPFDVQIFDVNADSRAELVVSVSSEHNGSLIVYEIPEHPENVSSVWPKRVLATGFRPLKEETGRSSPGSFRFLCPNPNAIIPTNFSCSPSSAGRKPFILLSGDDSGAITVFTPADNSSSSWNYQQDTVLQVEGTVGQMAVADVGNDGSAEVFIPDYNHNLMHVFSTRP